MALAGSFGGKCLSDKHNLPQPRPTAARDVAAGPTPYSIAVVRAAQGVGVVVVGGGVVVVGVVVGGAGVVVGGAGSPGVVAAPALSSP